MVGEMNVDIGGPLGTPHTARVMHRVLIVGLLLIAVVFLVITIGLHDAPLMAAGDATSRIGYLFAASGLVPIVLAMFIFKPRVPTRSAGQDDAAFWRVALGPAISVWVMIEGAGIISAVGALLSGSLASALVVAIALGCLVMFSPSHFENTYAAAPA